MSAEIRDHPTVIFEGGAEKDATVVAFDPDRDVAILHADVGGRTPLALGDGSFGGLYQRSPEDEGRLWEAAVQAIRERLERWDE